MYCTRSALIELIEQVDQIDVGSSPIITELVQWLPTHMIESFMEDARTALEIGDPEVDDPAEIAAMAQGKAEEQRVSAYLDLVQCSEV